MKKYKERCSRNFVQKVIIKAENWHQKALTFMKHLNEYFTNNSAMVM